MLLYFIFVSDIISIFVLVKLVHISPLQSILLSYTAYVSITRNRTVEHTSKCTFQHYADHFSTISDIVAVMLSLGLGLGLAQ